MRALYILGLIAFAILARRWKRFALLDPITRSGNSLALERFLRSRRRRVFNGSLFLVDIDSFAKINSTFSYATGDGILSELVARLQDHLGESARIFRYKYGDEFLAIVEGGTQLEGEKRKLRFLADLEQKPFALAGGKGEISISVSIGHLFIDHGYLKDPSIFDRLEDKLRESKKRPANEGNNENREPRSELSEDVLTDYKR